MKASFARALWPTVAALPALCNAASDGSSIESGRWLTQSGNLEIEFASCGQALCGTAVKVLANRSMSGGGEMTAADTRSPLGMKILTDLVPRGTDEWQGRVYNRDNGRTYDCRLRRIAPDRLELRAYKLLPLFGKTQVWTRVAATPEAAPAAAAPIGTAAEFAGINTWLNSPPLTLQQLRGKVVLVEFWTHSCVNCLRTLPHVVRLYESYREQGLMVVGVHTPETLSDRQTRDVRSAIGRLRIRFPVALDNDYATWNAYRNQFWPATYLIDQHGNLVRKHVGESDLKEMERAIRSLLALDGAASTAQVPRGSTSL